MRLIDADVLLETGAGIKMIIPVNCHPYEAIRIQGNAFRKAVEESPTIDAVEVVHGRWEIIMDDYECELMRCSCCGSEFYDGDNDTVDHLHNYCPHCGAKMDRERKTE